MVPLGVQIGHGAGEFGGVCGCAGSLGLSGGRGSGERALGRLRGWWKGSHLSSLRLRRWGRITRIGLCLRMIV